MVSNSWGLSDIYTAVPATVGQIGQDDHDVPDPENPTDPSNYHACVKKYTCSGCLPVEESELVEVIYFPFFPPIYIETVVINYYCKSGLAHGTDTYDAEFQQMQVLTGEECEVPVPGTQVEEPVIP